MTRTGARRHHRLAIRAIAALAVIGAIGIGTGSTSDADGVPAADRRYTVTVHKIRALDETGPFNFGLSDEIYAGFTTVFAGGILLETQSQLFGNFDAGETRTPRSDQNCVLGVVSSVNNGGLRLRGLEGDRWSCNPHGFPAPFEFHAVLWERDSSVPCVDSCRFNPRELEFSPGLQRNSEPDDRVGYSHITFSAAGLASHIPNVGNARDYDVEHKGSGGHYSVTYRVTRTG